MQQKHTLGGHHILEQMEASRSPRRKHDIPLLYKYTSPETAKAVLLGRSLRWSSPQLFNDPFDVRRELELPFTNDELFDALIDRFGAYLWGEGEPTNPYAKQLLAGLRIAATRAPVEALLQDLRRTLNISIFPMDAARQQLRAAWDGLLPIMRILCLSTDPTSPPMWAHYASGYTGVVLGFESSDERDSTWLLAEPVVYSDKVPSLPGADDWAKALLGEQKIDWERWLAEYHFVKSTHWSYEKEYRIHSLRKPGEEGLFADYIFAREDLREIILGPRASEELEIIAKAAIDVAYTRARIRRAREDRKNHRIVIED